MSLTSLVPGFKRKSLDPPPLRVALDRFFEDWFNGDADVFGAPGWNGFVPRLDVAEDEKKVVVTAELPGMTEKDVEIQLDAQRLLIKGEKSEETKEEKKNFYRRECHYGVFQREVPLPAEVVGNKVKAKFKNGVLKVTLPKTPEARQKSRKIAIEAAH